MMNKLIKLLLVTAVIFGASFNASAENMKKMGNMNVHYIALGATFLTPAIATEYGIERSRFNGLINISVLDNSQQGNPAKKVALTGTARNDLGQIKQLEFDEVVEGDAIYYLAQVRFSDEETFHFDINITDGKESHTLKFKQKFYVD